MPLSKKNLESFLWDRPAECFDRGLTGLVSSSERYRRVNLLPYGTADLVLIETSLNTHDCFVQVVELSTGPVTLDMYLRAKRYQTALRYVLQRVYAQAGQRTDINLCALLIGRGVEATGSLVHALNHDHNCESFCYTHDELTGIHFEEVSKDWKLAGSESRPLVRLGEQWFQVLRQQLAHHANQPVVQRTPPVPARDPSASLVVTATGVIDWHSSSTPPTAGNDGAN